MSDQCCTQIEIMHSTVRVTVRSVYTSGHTVILYFTSVNRSGPGLLEEEVIPNHTRAQNCKRDVNNATVETVKTQVKRLLIHAAVCHFMCCADGWVFLLFE